MILEKEISNDNPKKEITNNSISPRIWKNSVNIHGSRTQFSKSYMHGSFFCHLLFCIFLWSVHCRYGAIGSHFSEISMYASVNINVANFLYFHVSNYQLSSRKMFICPYVYKIVKFVLSTYTNQWWTQTFFENTVFSRGFGSESLKGHNCDLRGIIFRCKHVWMSWVGVIYCAKM